LKAESVIKARITQVITHRVDPQPGTKLKSSGLGVYLRKKARTLTCKPPQRPRRPRSAAAMHTFSPLRPTGPHSSRDHPYLPKYEHGTKKRKMWIIRKMHLNNYRRACFQKTISHHPSFGSRDHGRRRSIWRKTPHNTRHAPPEIGVASRPRPTDRRVGARERRGRFSPI